MLVISRKLKLVGGIIDMFENLVRANVAVQKFYLP